MSRSKRLLGGLKAIREAAIAAITEDFKPFLDELNVAKEAALTTYVKEDAPQYRVLLKHKAEILNEISPMASKNEMEMTLHRQLHKRQTDLKQEGIRIIAEAENVQDTEPKQARSHGLASRIDQPVESQHG